MGKFSFKDMVGQAKASGALADPPDSQEGILLKAVGASVGSTKAGDPRIGVRWKVEDGPQAGRAFWDNINFIASSEENMAISFELFRKWGVGDDFWEAEPSDEQIKERILQIGTIRCNLKVVPNGDFTNYRYNKVSLLGQGVDPSVPSIPSATSAPAAVTTPAPAPAAAPTTSVPDVPSGRSF